MDMEIAKARALRKHAEETLDELAIVCQLLRASASDKNVEITVDIILAILKDGFLERGNRLLHAARGKGSARRGGNLRRAHKQYL